MPVLNTIGGFLGTNQPGQPGVGSTNQTNGDVSRYDIPIAGQPGAFYNPQTGQIIHTDQDGNPYVAGAPNLNDLTAAAAGNQLTQQQVAQGLQQQQQQVLGQQTGLAASFNNTINNPGAPSVAASELGAGLNEINGTQMGNAAGATGENAVVARRTAAQNIAGAGVAKNQQAAQLRAGEVANAQTGLANTLNSQNNTLTSGINNATGAATTYGGQGITAQGNNATLQEKEDENNAKQNSGLLGSIGNAGTALMSTLG